MDLHIPVFSVSLSCATLLSLLQVRLLFTGMEEISFGHFSWGSKMLKLCRSLKKNQTSDKISKYSFGDLGDRRDERLRPSLPSASLEEGLPPRVKLHYYS